MSGCQRVWTGGCKPTDGTRERDAATSFQISPSKMRSIHSTGGILFIRAAGGTGVHGDVQSTVGQLK